MASINATADRRVVGYIIFGHDNGSHFFETPPPQGVLCPRCKSVLNTAFRPARLNLRTKLDVSSTYDNVKVVSTRFRALCDDHMLPGLAFHPFQGQDAEYFFAEGTREVEFDAARRKTRFLHKCDRCGNFEEVIGVTPAYLRVPKPVERGFFRTNIAFGSGASKRPAVIVDIETAVMLKRHKLRGMDLHEAEGQADAI